MNKKILCMLTPILVLPFFVLGKKANAYNIVEQPICGLAINTATCKSLNDYETYDKIYTNEFLHIHNIMHNTYCNNYYP